jgi:hypothetical protein
VDTTPIFFTTTDLPKCGNLCDEYNVRCVHGETKTFPGQFYLSLTQTMFAEYVAREHRTIVLDLDEHYKDLSIDEIMRVEFETESIQFDQLSFKLTSSPG